MRRPGRAFTLAEVMVSIFFLSIALFGYMSLHIRLMHSGMRLEVRQAQREQAARALGDGIRVVREFPRLDTHAATGPMEDLKGGPAGLRRLRYYADFNYSASDDEGGKRHYSYVVDTFQAAYVEVGWPVDEEQSP